jgi:hypothetical protein
MERNSLGGEKWERNDLKIRFQQFLSRPVRTLAENATFCQARPNTYLAHPDTCREMNLRTILSRHKISLSGHTTQKLNSKCFLSVIFPHLT